ncbi:uncharacterized protein PHALS_06860 [Plasmopara halstedii]|uniref:Uncharacterized protein n=1 Tax=Plasmopara halstedii TaxID=4781 RepID=A0A0P1B406_PLAHL|nr:uncharacterized protein PHALS_06860 [Plasmopara halstedii]CEG49074.1 hypothetical protein PHALS_06860 [Plasmopara halstedii]|eukprot:XP_024585443.1 hypothetical protein PHALS_06860 [Plasmopara halstedii]
MKRMRDDITNQNNNMDDLGMTPPPSSLWASMSPCKSQHASTKRYRDRSVPIDALSCLMSAAVTNARMKKHSSITRLFAGKIEASRVCVAVCECAANVTRVVTPFVRCARRSIVMNSSTASSVFRATKKGVVGSSCRKLSLELQLFKLEVPYF